MAIPSRQKNAERIGEVFLHCIRALNRNDAVDSCSFVIYLARESAQLPVTVIFAVQGGVLMTKPLSGTSDKDSDLSEGFMAEAEESEGTDFEPAEPVAPPRTSQKDPMLRRKIEDRLERKRLREELGIYDEDAWEDI
jgi:hypothetical protein